MKALVMIRVSTEAQELVDQHREMEVFCKEEGYDELVFVEDKGASAIKLNDQYRMMIDQVKEEIGKDSSIRCFAVWELSRAFRNEGVYYEIKEYLLEHNVQFICKNPYLKLLNPDGTLNTGMEVAMSLLATLAKQEMELKKERFKRAKTSMKKQGKFIGGIPKYGYKVGPDGYMVIDEEKAEVIRKVFEMYSTGKWSERTLSEELRERGYDVSYQSIQNTLSSEIYVNGPYPQLISQELWDKCRSVKDRNVLGIPKGRRYCFGSGIFKCGLCGRNMVAEGSQYRCWHHNKLSYPPFCENNITIRVENLDGLLWFVAVQEETKYRMKMDASKKDEYEEKIKVLREKMVSIEKRSSSIEDKKSRIVELYVDGVISKEEKEKRLSGTSEESKRYKDTILSYKEQEGALLQLLEGLSEDSVNLDRLKNIYEGVIGENDLKVMNDIVKKHIRKVVSLPEWFGRDRDNRAIRQNAQLIVVETVYSGVRKYIYVARKYKGHKFFVYKSDGSEVPLVTVKPIIREPMGPLHPRAFKKLSELE